MENKEFFNFIDNTPNAYICAKNLKEELLEYGFEELSEYEKWSDLKNQGKYFVSKGDSSLIAFTVPENNADVGFNIVATHSDSPSFSIKTNPDIFENGYLKLNVDEYGGIIYYSWLDRTLSIAGRVITQKDGGYQSQFINIDEDLLIIPSQAYHQNREVNKENKLNPQVDMLPIMSLSNEDSLAKIIDTYLKENCISFDRICDYDLYLYNRDKAKLVGINQEFILAPRLDDLGCVYPAFKSFIEEAITHFNYNFNVCCVFNNEEIGSLTQQGADSEFLMDTLKRIAEATNIDLLTALRNSMVISADNGHAIHPNAPSKSDPTNKVELNKGIVIKNNPRYTTDALTSSLFKGICDNANAKYQMFACRNDLRCGSTLGGLSQSHVSVNSIDIGLPQLAMHSATETMGSKDIQYLYDALFEFYRSYFAREDNKVYIKKYSKY